MGTDGDRPAGGHLPVMAGEVVELLSPRPGGVILDCTVGEGGHAARLLPRIVPGGLLVGLDRDETVVATARRNLERFRGSVRLEKANYTELKEALELAGLEKVDGVLFDLGVNSAQLDNPERGFSFRFDGPLDMRMDSDESQTAAELVNRLPRRELEYLIRKYGEERFAGRISRRIAEERDRSPIRTTGRLVEIVRRAVGVRGKIHPATRTFQALRLAVNRELENLARALPEALEALRPGGRLCLIAFHSLEDRIVKNTFRGWAAEGKVRLLTAKPLRPSAGEAGENPRARSARLRAAEKVDPAGEPAGRR